MHIQPRRRHGSQVNVFFTLSQAHIESDSQGYSKTNCLCEAGSVDCSPDELTALLGPLLIHLSIVDGDDVGACLKKRTAGGAEGLVVLGLGVVVEQLQALPLLEDEHIHIVIRGGVVGVADIAGLPARAVNIGLYDLQELVPHSGLTGVIGLHD